MTSAHDCSLSDAASDKDINATLKHISILILKLATDYIFPLHCEKGARRTIFGLHAASQG